MPQDSNNDSISITEVTGDAIDNLFAGLTPPSTPPVEEPKKPASFFQAAQGDFDRIMSGKEETETPAIPTDASVEQSLEEEPEKKKPLPIQHFVEKGILRAFEGEEDFSAYDDDKIAELIQANIEAAKEEAIQGELEALPEEIRQVIQYVKDGGEDVTGLMSMMGMVREQQELDLENPAHHEMIVRNYLILNGVEESVIEDQVVSYKDRKGKMEEMARKYKPQLDLRMKEAVDEQLKEQAAHRQRSADAMRKYTESVKSVVSKNELGGIKIDDKTKDSLVKGMTTMQHKSLFSGKPVNEMAHLLETYQFGDKPNHQIVMEALWLLRDPEGYKKKIREIGSSEEAVRTNKLIKREQGSQQPGATSIIEEDTTVGRKQLAKPTNFISSINRK